MQEIQEAQNQALAEIQEQSRLESLPANHRTIAQMIIDLNTLPDQEHLQHIEKHIQMAEQWALDERQALADGIKLNTDYLKIKNKKKLKPRKEKLENMLQGC